MDLLICLNRSSSLSDRLLQKTHHQPPTTRPGFRCPPTGPYAPPPTRSSTSMKRNIFSIMFKPSQPQMATPAAAPKATAATARSSAGGRARTPGIAAAGSSR
jgi:hypothetical protein